MQTQESRSRSASWWVSIALVVALAGVANSAAAQSGDDESGPTSVEDAIAGLTRMDGFFDIYWDESTGRLHWEIDHWDTEFLYQVSAASGLGSNPVGLDRGQLGGTYVLEARRVGPRVLLVQQNYRYRALSDNPDEVRAVADAFAPSVLWGFEVEARTGERVLVDATDFFLRDTHGAAARMEQAGQGTFVLDRSRSVFHLAGTRAFPENVEIETLLTFTSENPGPLVRSVAANGTAVTLRQRHSLVQLPNDDYTPRVMDSRVGVNGPTFYDYASPIDEGLSVHWVSRHRLQKKNPNAERSEAVEPIVYYVDRGAPEPIRSALIEGGNWWNEAFEAAGFIDAFRVEVLPGGADPQDVRYNMVHWTHRSTRGWSYGGSVSDPRTGEIIKGNVNLGSLRLRQDYLKGQSLAPRFAEPLGACGLSAAPGFEYLAQVSSGTDPVDMALARVRQLSAHEIGHTLGFPHNYIASTYGGRASVMDYPAPLVKIADDGTLDLSDAYATGIGAYDKVSVNWLYREFASGQNEQAELAAIEKDALDSGMRFMAHTDNAFVGAGHPLASVWDNGGDLVEGLEHELEVRRIALAGFGPSVIREGEPMSELERVLLPLYLHHRFQLTSGVQNLGGADYSYALRGDGQTPIAIVPGDQQRRVLDAVLSTLSVDFLALPQRILDMIPPPAYRSTQDEAFDGNTGLTFDALSVAATGARLSVEALLHPDRMARLVEFGSRSAEYPGLDDVVGRLVEVTWKGVAPADTYLAEVQATIQRVVLDVMMGEASRAENPASVRAYLSDGIIRLAEWLKSRDDTTPHQRLAIQDIRRWERRPTDVIPSQLPRVPPGSPIGG